MLFSQKAWIPSQRKSTRKCLVRSSMKGHELVLQESKYETTIVDNSWAGQFLWEGQFWREGRFVWDGQWEVLIGWTTLSREDWDGQKLGRILFKFRRGGKLRDIERDR